MFFKSSCAIFVAVIMLSLCILATAAPYQELEPRKGHVPVYIRHGDEALSNIHPGLAEAFNEQTLKAENLVEETAPATTVEAKSDLAESSTVSDIASFDAIKAKDE